MGIWTLFEGSCQLRDITGQHVSRANSTPVEKTSKAGVLLLGDSSDRNLVYDFCQAAGVEVVPFDITSEAFGEHTCNRPDSSGTYKDEVMGASCLHRADNRTGAGVLQSGLHRTFKVSRDSTVMQRCDRDLQG